MYHQGKAYYMQSNSAADEEQEQATTQAPQSQVLQPSNRNTLLPPDNGGVQPLANVPDSDQENRRQFSITQPPASTAVAYHPGNGVPQTKRPRYRKPDITPLETDFILYLVLHTIASVDAIAGFIHYMRQNDHTGPARSTNRLTIRDFVEEHLRTVTLPCILPIGDCNGESANTQLNCLVQLADEHRWEHLVKEPKELGNRPKGERAVARRLRKEDDNVLSTKHKGGPTFLNKTEKAMASARKKRREFQGQLLPTLALGPEKDMMLVRIEQIRRTRSLELEPFRIAPVPRPAPRISKFANLKHQAATTSSPTPTRRMQRADDPEHRAGPLNATPKVPQRRHKRKPNSPSPTPGQFMA